MNIVFDRLYIQNFQSIGEAHLTLSERGVVTVTGVNNYDDNTLSNGSGKSSIFASLFWVLYGKTPEGINDPTNKYSGGICQVSIEFSVDNNEYKVSRSMRGGSQSVSLYINGADQSGRNKSDSDKIIRNDILHMSSDIFLSLVYLSQGFATRLSSLTPSARKDRLEQLTNTAEIIEELSAHISGRKSQLNDVNRVYRDSIAKKEGSIESIQSSIEEMKSRLESANIPKVYRDLQGNEYNQLDIPQLQQQLNELYKSEVAVRENFDKANADYSEHKRILNDLDSSIDDYLSRRTNTLSDIDKVNSQGVCPTCHQILQVSNKEALLQKYVSDIKEYGNKLTELERSFTAESLREDELAEAVSRLREELNRILSQSNFIRDTVSKIPNVPVVDTQSIQNDIQNYEQKCETLRSEKESTMKSLSDSEISLDIINHCQQMVTKAFRAYLLTSIINYMNVRLKEYSAALFSNESDIITISSDSQKLDICLGDSDYVTLSGGERRKVDLATMLAQRDLAAELAGVTCNLLVLDEIMESMDETATQVTLDLLESRSDTVDSMFIISHNNYALPVDSRITVTKGPNRISTVTDI